MKNKKIEMNMNISFNIFKSDNSIPDKGVFCGGVEEPSIDHLAIWVDDLEEFDFKKNSFTIKGDQVNIKGDAKSLYDLGKLLIGMSVFETQDPSYHTHLSNLKIVEGKSYSEIIIHRIGKEFDYKGTESK